MNRRKNTVAGKVALVASASLLAVALPSSVFAIGALSDSDTSDSSFNQMIFTPASADPAMAELIAERSGSKARMMRFTPASVATAHNDRSVTVSVRVDQRTASALAAASGIANSRDGEGASSGLRVTPTRYNLGLARGFASFTPAPSRTPTLSGTLTDANIPDISDFSPRSVGRDEPSRFAARVEMDENRPAGRAAGARDTIGDQMLDVGGSYRLTNNLDITAGVRIEQDRDIVPLPDIDQQDSQAVYIGTQFRF